MRGLFARQGVEYYAQAGAVRHDFYISDEIGEPGEYATLLQALHTATPQDHIVIHINSPGGNLYTAAQIADAMSSSNAGSITARAEGLIASAATIIFLAAHTWYVSQFSTYLFHTSSGFSAGRAPDVRKQNQAHDEYLIRVCSMVYQDFFTEEEIHHIVHDGHDMWLTPEEVNERLDRVEEAMKAEQQQSTEQYAKLASILKGAGMTDLIKFKTTDGNEIDPETLVSATETEEGDFDETEVEEPLPEVDEPKVEEVPQKRKPNRRKPKDAGSEE